MKHLRRVVGGAIGLLLLLGILIILIRTLETQTTPFETNLAFQSPLEPATPTAISTPTPTRVLPPLGLPSPTPSPTITPIGFVPSATPTWPPPPPTRTPSPTFTPAPPTSTPEPLPTLIPGFDTLVYATTNEKGWPELYRVQIDESDYTSESRHRIDIGEISSDRTYINGLYPSPNSLQVAIDWNFGGGGNFISILNVDDGQVTQPFGTESLIDSRVSFVDWSPSGNAVLVRGLTDNLDLGNRLWLIDMKAHKHRLVDTKGVPVTAHFESASFSPDGKAIIYAYQLCYQCSSEVWYIPLDDSMPKRLFEAPEIRIAQILWSPNGRYIAFTQWQENKAKNFRMGEENRVSAIGELWIFDIETSEKRLLSSVLTGLYEYFQLTWTPDSQQIMFVSTGKTDPIEQINKLSSNIYIVDISNAQVTQVTNFVETLVLKPVWTPDKSSVVFLAQSDSFPQQFTIQKVEKDGRNPHPLYAKTPLIIDTQANQPSMVWVPTFLAGDKK